MPFPLNAACIRLITGLGDLFLLTLVRPASRFTCPPSPPHHRPWPPALRRKDKVLTFLIVSKPQKQALEIRFKYKY